MVELLSCFAPEIALSSVMWPVRLSQTTGLGAGSELRLNFLASVRTWTPGNLSRADFRKQITAARNSEK
jgi:hypothetical protein